MINRTIAVALLAGLASPVLAGAFLGPAYDQANGINTVKSADSTFDGSTPRTAVQAPVAGAQPAGVPAVTAPLAATVTAAPPALSTEALAAEKSQTKGSFVKNLEAKAKGIFNKRSLELGAGGAMAGAGLGFLFGGPLGAVVGALVGFGIGLVLSKMLHKKH
jgi:hypothetical protein